MSITVDATKGWARPANASEWTALLAGTGLPNPVSAWQCTEASGNLADCIGSLTLSAAATPLYAQSATGWAGTGIAFSDNTTDGFTTLSGPDPATTSQVWLWIVALASVPPATPSRVIGGMAIITATATRAEFVPSGANNALRVRCNAVVNTGSVDHAAGDHIIALTYDRAGSRVAAQSQLETVTGTYSSAVVNGTSGMGRTASLGNAVIMYCALWTGTDAEGLDATDISTIMSQIQSPPSGGLVDDDPGRIAQGIIPAQIIQRPTLQAYEEFPSANFALEDDWQPSQKERGYAEPHFLPPRYLTGWTSEEWMPQPPVALDEQPRYPNQRLYPQPRLYPRAPLFWGDETIALAYGGPTIGPPGTTLAAWQAGSFAGKWVAAIEGYQYLLTDATTTQATTAWTGTGFSSALHGLCPMLTMQQRIDPWNPFADTGGKLTLSVAPDSAGTFRTDIHKVAPAISTFLDANVDCDDQTYTVKSTTPFASSGTVYIGSEAATYTSKTSTTFQNLRRGVYAPFRTLLSGTEGFAHQHTISTDPNNISLPPVVSATPRSWIGKWVGLWRHLVKSSLLNSKDDAQCCFAGRIAGVRQNPETMNTEIECEHVLQAIGNTVIGNDLWSAEIADGVWIDASQGAFGFSDNNAVTTKVATPLTVVTTTPASVYEIKQGRYEIMALIHRLNAWLAQAKVDGDLSGTYTFSLENHDPAIGMQLRIQYRIPGTGVGFFSFGMSPVVWQFLGKPGPTVTQAGSVFWWPQGLVLGATDRLLSSEGVRRFLGANSNSVELTNERGTYYDETGNLPAQVEGNLDPSYQVNEAVIMIDGKDTAVVSRSAVVGDPAITSRFDRIAPFKISTGAGVLNAPAIETMYDDPRIKVQQIFVRVASFATMMKRLFYSTGTSGYNHSEFDVHPIPIAMSVPGELLGSAFEQSIDLLPGAQLSFTLIVTQPVKLTDLLGADLTLRWAFLRWRDEHVEFWSWMTPVDSSTVLQESNKASPASVVDEQRSATALDDGWQRNVIKIEHDRDFTASEGAGGGSGYHGHIQVIDRVAIDDCGGQAKVQTINAQNTYNQHVLGGSGGVESLMPNFKAIAPFFTRPVRRIARTIDPRFFEGYSIGDVVLATDSYACDPDTGALGVSLRPGVIVAHGYTPGGFTPQGTVADMHGEVEIMFLDNLKVGPYVPTAEVDDTSTNGGYNAGTEKITVYAHKHSGPSEDRDVVQFPETGTSNAIVDIIEVDPEDPTAPLAWTGIEVSQSPNSNVLGLNGALPAPAWDSTKRYRVVFTQYLSAIAEQQVFSYQADDADGMIADSRVPYQYTVNTQAMTFPTPSWLKNTADDPVELPPDSSYGDGVGLDVGTDAATNRLINNLYDYKTAHSGPILGTQTDVSGDVTHAYQLYAVIPINLSPDVLSFTVRRYLYVAPFAYSSDGAGLCRITLARNMPNSDDTVYDVDRGVKYGETEFTLTNTSYSTPTPQPISIGDIKDGDGNAYLLIELKVPIASGSAHAYCRGLGACYEGPRFTFTI